MRVYFVRHGESQANRGKFFAGQTDIPLTDTGRGQAEAIRPILADIPFDKVYSSDLSRAKETQTLALPGYTAETTPLIREIDVGTLAGKSIPEMAAKNGGVTPTSKSGDYTPFGGENRAMLDARIQKFMATLEKEPYDNVAVFAHRGVLMSTLRYVLESPDLSNGSVNCDNCAINVVEFDGKSWRLLAVNYGKKI